VSSDPKDLSALGYRQELRRALSFLDLLAYGLVFIVPIAPVAVFGIVFNASHGMVPLVYAIGLGAMLFTALSYRAMTEAFPVAGSVYTYASRSLGTIVGFAAGWAMLLDYLLLPALTYIAGAIAVQAALPMLPKPVCIVLSVAVVTLINYFGITTTARASFVLLAFQLLILAFFAVLAIPAIAHHVAGTHWSMVPFFNPHEFTARLAFGALSLAVLSFLGFDAISTLSEESKGGFLAIGRATVWSLCISAMLFIMLTWLASLFVLGATALPAGEATNAAFYNIAVRVGGYGLKFLFTVPGVFLAGIAGAVTAQTATARLIFGMARDGELPGALAHVDVKRQVPQRALWLVAGVTLVLSLSLVEQLELLVSMVSFGALVGFLLLHASVIGHFVWRQKSRRWLRHLVLPLIGLSVIAYVLLNTASNAKVAGTAWLGIGLILFITRKCFRRLATVPGEPQARSLL
jgi:amino acid transporter